MRRHKASGRAKVYTREELAERRKRWLAKPGNLEKQRAAQRRWKERRKTTPDQVHYWYIKSRYGLTRDEFDLLLAYQAGACAICRLPFNDRPCVDHDHHDDGHVRGLLCRMCNVGLGYLEGRPGWVESAAGYLKRDAMKRMQEALG